MSQVVWAVLITMSAILSFTTVLFVVSPFVDKFQGKMSNIGIEWEGSAVFPHMAQVGADMFNWFYAVPVFFMYLFILWMFKVVIYKHLYASEEAQNGI